MVEHNNELTKNIKLKNFLVASNNYRTVNMVFYMAGVSSVITDAFVMGFLRIRFEVWNWSIVLALD